MTDMRATERLLEVIQDLRNDAVSAYWQEESPLPMLNEIDEAITELRRRGDTLVRAADLQLVLAAIDQRAPEVLNLATPRKALDRLENALGGKPL